MMRAELQNETVGAGTRIIVDAMSFFLYLGPGATFTERVISVVQSSELGLKNGWEDDGDDISFLFIHIICETADSDESPSNLLGL